MRFPAVEQLTTQFGGTFAYDARRLTSGEIEIARPLFGSSIAYKAVRIVLGYFANAPTTLGNHVRISLESRLDESSLVHELTHV
jgi:hypothetical protein